MTNGRFFCAWNTALTEPFDANHDSTGLEYPSLIDKCVRTYMIKTFFSLVIGAIFAIATLLLIGIYWLFSSFAYAVSFVLLPFRKLLGKF